MSSLTARTASARVPAGLLALRALPARQPHGDCPVAGRRQAFGRGQELFADGDAAEFFYKVVSGTVRSVKLLSDGRRQIDAFHLAGDIFGLESGEEHRVTAEAVDEVVVEAYRRSRFASLLHDDPAFGDKLMSAMLVNLERAHEHMVLLGRKTAQERMATFLLDMACRVTHDGKAERFELPMQRTDIADHLGLTIETVSRTLTQMVRDGLIKLAAAGRTIVLADKAGLQELNV
jgi:CRP/FNR family nitrogen fixation transcriptional regulator